MNKVFLIGNLTKDPEVSVVSGDLKNCKFSIAVSRRYGSKETDYFSVVCWRAVAENCGKYLKKGSKVCVFGSVQNKNYEAPDGTKRYSVEIVAEDVRFLSPRNEAELNELPEATNAIRPAASKISELKPVDDDGSDLPF